MDRDIAISTLKRHKARLLSLGVQSASLFGSTARGEQQDASDVDVAVRLAPHFSDGGFHYFGKLDALRAELGELLGVEVDVVVEPVRNPELRAAIERDRLVAFQ